MKKLFKYTLLVALLLVITVLLAEIVLGVVFHFKDKGLEPMAVRDYPYLYYLFEKSDGLNEHGFKTNYPVKRQEGKFRIVLIGGSVARGKQPHETIAHFLEEKLNNEFQKDRVEVINAGMSAFVVEQEFLLIQLIIQHYEPDVIIGLDGYNDIVTIDLNRRWESGFELPPHNWVDFRSFESNREERKTWSRLPMFFRNINRAVQYFHRRKFEEEFDWKSFDDDKMLAVSKTYWQIIDDTRDFCRSKNISYYSFIQPLKYYTVHSDSLDPQKQTLKKLYALMDKGADTRSFAFSMSSLLKDQPDLFTDDCHVVAKGNELIAEAIAVRIAFEIQAWSEN